MKNRQMNKLKAKELPDDEVFDCDNVIEIKGSKQNKASYNSNKTNANKDYTNTCYHNALIIKHTHNNQTETGSYF